MRAFFAFTRKELMEAWRTGRFAALAIVFVLIGILSPFIALITPDLIRIIPGASGMITLPEPAATDSWIQFFKNVGQLGLLALMIVYGGVMANEFGRGTLVNLLTKGMRRPTVVLAKLAAASAVWAFSYLISAGICAAYTAFLWEPASLHHVFWAFLGPWLYGELLIALLMLGGVLFKGMMGSLLLAGGAIVGMSLMDLSPVLDGFNPVSVASNAQALLLGTSGFPAFAGAFASCAALVVMLTVASIVVFDKKQV
jgi:ABC-2 type transport system permease protein